LRLALALFRAYLGLKGFLAVARSRGKAFEGAPATDGSQRAKR